MVNSISSPNINPVQLLNAVNAFKATTAIQEPQVPETSDGLDITGSNILENQNIDEIKQLAQKAGEDNLSNEDIQYGLTYGRSLIADYVI